jgi:hypothetical protein
MFAVVIKHILIRSHEGMAGVEYSMFFDHQQIPTTVTNTYSIAASEGLSSSATSD